MIREERHILWTWVLTIVLIRLSLFFPHRFLDEIRLINTWIQILLCLMTIFIAHKSKGTQRYVYINFACYFGLILLLFAGTFIGETLFMGSPYASFYYYFYINCLGNGFFSLFLIIYILIDYRFRRMRIEIKYAGSILLTTAVLLVLFTPYWYRPFDLYKQNDYLVFRDLNKIWTALSQELHRVPRQEELTERVRVSTEISENTRNIFSSNNEYWNRCLNSNNVATILWIPVRNMLIYLNILIVFALMVFLTMLYLLDKPYHPYIDKLFIILIPLFVLEAFHNYSYTQTFSTDNFRTLFTIGQYATVCIFAALMYILHLALRFSTSPAGMYYEEALITSPGKVTRWRDEIDIFLLRKFIKGYGLQ